MKGLLPWSHITEHMAAARCYWVCTVSPEGHPHATPVDGLWLDDRLYFGGGADTRRNRNLAANPAACIHLESGTEVVILHGEAHAFITSDRALAKRIADESNRKYGYGAKPENYETESGSFVFRPKVVYAWKAMLGDVTRWDVPPEG
jgi:hypothetical protein